MLGFLLVDKPRGITSHDAVYAVRRRLGIKRVGHSGTLDPEATGLLIMAVGSATRLLQFLPDEPKIYEGTIRLGIETSTQDAAGETVAVRDATSVTDDEVAAAASALCGEIDQLPPMFSAIKIRGEALYKRARKGETVDRPARRVTVHEFVTHPLNNNSFAFRISCSGGTYVRTIAHDLGKSLGVGAHLSSLRRTGMGEFDVRKAKEPSATAADDIIEPSSALAFPSYAPPPDLRELLRAGVAVQLDIEPSERISVTDPSGMFCLARWQGGGTWQPEVVLR